MNFILTGSNETLSSFGFVFSIFLKIDNRFVLANSFNKFISKFVSLLFWILWASLALHTHSDIINLQKTFAFICRQKINFIISNAFLKILQRNANCLFWVLWGCLVTRTQIYIINLQKTSMFIYMPRIQFIIHFLLEILHFKEPCNLIG